MVRWSGPRASSETILSLRGFGVAFADRVVLADVSMDLPRTGLTTLVGPAGSGKSTLLRTIAGLNDMHPALSTWGTALLDGKPLSARGSVPAGETRPDVGVVLQHARFFVDTVRENLVSALPSRSAFDQATQTALVSDLLVRHGLRELVPKLGASVTSLTTSLQRRLAIVRALVADPPILFADEPTSGLDEEDAIDILALLRVEAAHRAVFLVTHNQRFARVLGGNVVFMAGGRVCESGPAATFFDEPSTAPGRSFVATGSCALPSPNAQLDDLDPDAPSPTPLPEVAVTRSRFQGPRGFFWVRPGRLGGVPRPGIIDSLEYDLEGLQRLGVTVLVTLEETRTVPMEELAKCGIASSHMPIPDMGAPALELAAEHCRGVRDQLAAGAVVAVHCRAGLGRTGTMLASQLIFDGERAQGAIERIRRLNPKCIQSDVQVDFLSAFEAFVQRR